MTWKSVLLRGVVSQLTEHAQYWQCTYIMSTLTEQVLLVEYIFTEHAQYWQYMYMRTVLCIVHAYC